ncbi:uncharacterized protein TNCV_1952821 [Trichonephila clavipes]|nr:uncharacterized protein TNCV_1952821 [Trichonephila clavipes]
MLQLLYIASSSTLLALCFEPGTQQRWLRARIHDLSQLFTTTQIFTNYGLKFTCRNCGGGDRGRVAIYRPFGEVSLSLNRTVTCMVLKANDRRTSCPCHDEFHGPRSDYVRQADIAFLSVKIIKTTVLYLLERVNINVALFSYMRAFGNGPRNFEPWSSDVDDT